MGEGNDAYDPVQDAPRPSDDFDPIAGTYDAGKEDYDPTEGTYKQDEPGYDPEAHRMYDAEEQERFQEAQAKYLEQANMPDVLVDFRRELQLGCNVEVHGLVGQRYYNGCTGTLIEQKNRTGRLEVLVQLPDGRKKELALLQENVFRVPGKWTIDLCNLPPDVVHDPDGNAREFKRFHKYGPCKVTKSERRNHLNVTYEHFDDAMDVLEDVHKFVMDGERLDLEWVPLSRSQMEWRDRLNKARDDDLRTPELRYLEGEMAQLNGEQCEVLDNVSDGTAQVEVKGQKFFVHERNLVPNDINLRQKWELETLRLRAAAAAEARKNKELEAHEKELADEEKKMAEEAAQPKKKKRRMWGMTDYVKTQQESQVKERPLENYTIRELKQELRGYGGVDWMSLVEKKDLIAKLLDKRKEDHNKREFQAQQTKDAPKPKTVDHRPNTDMTGAPGHHDPFHRGEVCN